MFYDDRPCVFHLTATDNGTMIVSNLDWESAGKGCAVGVAVELFNKSNYEANEIEFLCTLLDLRRKSLGPGVVAIDGGANIGCYTLPFAKFMTGWGSVLGFEPQERLFYALAGNIALNNCFNAKALNAALGAACGTVDVPSVDYTKPRNLGGVEMRDAGAMADGYGVPLLSLDSFALDRLDLLKLDIEGMELMALRGAKASIERHRPLLHIEHIKCGEAALRRMLEPMGYAVQMVGMNVLGIHESDPITKQISFVDKSRAAA